MICALCPRHCNALRTQHAGEGFCRQGTLPRVARAALHAWEEPCISGTRGSGTIFFSGCTLRCIYCQNYSISHNGQGKTISTQRLADIFRELEEQGAHNINLVNPTHFIPAIVQALSLYRPGIPIVYNTGGYEDVATLTQLEGLVDIYLPDLKYVDSPPARIYSQAANYPDVCGAALQEMCRQTGACTYDKQGLMQRGTLVRHLILPGMAGHSMRVLNWIYENLPAGTPVSLMGQYTPCGDAVNTPGMDRPLKQREYAQVVAHMQLLHLPGYTQSLHAADAAFIPPFDCSGV